MAAEEMLGAWTVSLQLSVTALSGCYSTEQLPRVGERRCPIGRTCIETCHFAVFDMYGLQVVSRKEARGCFGIWELTPFALIGALFLYLKMICRLSMSAVAWRLSVVDYAHYHTLH